MMVPLSIRLKFTWPKPWKFLRPEALPLSFIPSLTATETTADPQSLQTARVPTYRTVWLLMTCPLQRP